MTRGARSSFSALWMTRERSSSASSPRIKHRVIFTVAPASPSGGAFAVHFFGWAGFVLPPATGLREAFPWPSAENGAATGEAPRHSAAKLLPNAAKKARILVLYCAFTCNNERTREKAVEPLFMRISLILKG